MDELLPRINELAKKKKEGTITEAELSEQKELRSQYLKQFRENFRSVLMNTKVVDPEGTDVTPQKLKDAQAERRGDTPS
ncbi:MULTISPECIES: DUF896 domain-containing protein [Aerococcus]|uniref:UPF0291 protein F6I03_07185 n=1 Tax=Aerococcus sanguinicola TaxID=119206 RepID=A0A5N1GII9_9LACT|nr:MULTISPECIES: DUF896 domain-containing protein [Aerococcus]KAA9300582.1 DUF896 domain-containing protein [Aerococcus sanguinicola]MDK6369618.1 DUF896 domain-containing protein [Aerococcus sp. UMB9870]MDK6680123.1 DUF896 domain-containing protein [Aerococcus sp. UMB8608]MDK6686284.1 DUF896 domain-containing protein [Aerococcus sp. UMB8623]MDK6940204.1 DUF896 domain-containing protein [Aerococcus sp. UMB8487]